MNGHLLAISIGPVQGFISAARRTRDFWMGSTILSEISKSVAKFLLDEHQAELIFPAPRDNRRDLEPIDIGYRGTGEPPWSDFNASNVILCRLALPAATPVRDTVAGAKAKAHARWRDFAGAAAAQCRSDIDTAIWQVQYEADDVVEFFAAWAPLPPSSDYPAARARVMRLLAGRKACRDFRPAAGMAGKPKSSLDGARESVLLRMADDWTGQRTQRRRSGLHARPGEQLDIVGLTKRAEYGHDAVRYPSVSRIAADPWLRGVARVVDEFGAGSDVAACFDRLVEQCRELAQPQFRALRERTGGDLRKFPWLHNFPFEGTPLYRNRHQEIFDECPRPARIENDSEALFDFNDALEERLKSLGECVAALELKKGHNFGEPDPYLAVIVADGDRMGETLSAIGELSAHRLFSQTQSMFAAEVRKIVDGDAARDDLGFFGATVYAGADDLLALVPVDRSLDCARALHERFAEMIADVTPAGTKPPTLSVGVAIGHFLDPFEDLLDFGRAAEQAAKGTDRNGLAIAVHPRSGAGFTVREQWNDNDREASLDRRILRWASLFRDRQLPNKTPYDLRRLADVYDGWRNDPRPALQIDALRVFGRKRARDDDPAARRSLAEIRQLIGRLRTADDLRGLAKEMLVAQRIAAAMVQAGGSKAIRTTAAV